MKRVINLFTLSVIFSGVAVFNAGAYKPEDLKRFAETGECRKCDLSKADLSEIFNKLVKEGKRIDLKEADLTEVNISNTKRDIKNFGDVAKILRESNWNANFSGANLARANLSGLTLAHPNFKKANLKEANLSCGFFLFAHFKKANLFKSNLSNGIFIASNFKKADLGSMSREGADFYGSIFSPKSRQIFGE